MIIIANTSVKTRDRTDAAAFYNIERVLSQLQLYTVNTLEIENDADKEQKPASVPIPIR